MNLFDDPEEAPQMPESYRRARTNDHDTSKEAAEHISEEGRIATECAFALKCIRENPGWTQNELDQKFAPPENPRRVGQRCKDLLKDKTVRWGKKRVSRVSGMMSKTWWPIESTDPDSFADKKF